MGVQTRQGHVAARPARTLIAGTGAMALPGRVLVLALLGWMVSSLVLGNLTARTLPILTSWAADTGRLSAVIVAEVYALLIAWLVWLVRNTATGASRFYRLSVAQIATALGAWAGAYVAAAALYSMLRLLVPKFPSAADLVDWLVFIGTDMGRLVGADAITWVLVVTRACILAPIAEELLFRGALFGWLRAHTGAWTTIGLTAAGFAAIHALAPIMVPLALLVGVAAGYTRERVGSVTPVIVAHIVQNVIVELAGAFSIL